MHGLIRVPVSKLTGSIGDNANIIDEALYGTYVEVVEERINHYKIKTFYNYEGYLKKSDVSIIRERIDFPNTFNGVVIKPFADILASPDILTQAIISLPKGSYLKVLEEETNNGFCVVELVNERRGYIKESSIKMRKTPEKDNNLRFRIVSNAKSYLGSQYRYGGKTILGIDCSGLTSISYLLEDVIIYRDSLYNEEILEQYQLRKISRTDLQPADLIYCKGHVMMYIGDNQYIHSSGTFNGVGINSLNPADENYSEKHSKLIIAYATIF